MCCINFKEWGIWSVPILLFIINRATPTTVSGWHDSSSIWTTFTNSWQSSFNSSGHYSMSQYWGIRSSAFLLFLNHSLNTFWSVFNAFCKSFYNKASFLLNSFETFIISDHFNRGRPSSSPTKCNTVAASATFLQFSFNLFHFAWRI